MVSVWRKQSIAVVELYGTIGGAVRPAIYLPILERVRNSRRFRGLVIAIDSPGGSAAASEELYRGISKIASTKPVVAYIRERGASGAYYISCAAQKIVAVPNALVGSIGVIFARPTAEQLFQKVGLDFSIQKSGKYKDMYGPWRKPTPEEEAKVQAMIDEIYGRFITVVAEGRRIERDKVEEVATGEVFTAQRAKALNLIDELGDIDTAIDLAASLAGVKRRVAYLRPRRPFVRGLLGGVAEEMTQTLIEEVESRLLGRVHL